MTSFDIKPTMVKQASSSLHSSAAKISSLLSDANAVQRRLPGLMSQGQNLARGLSTMTAAMQSEQKRVRDLANTLDQIVLAYQNADNVSAGKLPLPSAIIGRPGIIPGVIIGPTILNPFWWILGPWRFFRGGGNTSDDDRIWHTNYVHDPDDPFTIGEGNWDYYKHGKTPEDKTRKGKGTLADRWSDYKDAHSTDHNYQKYYDLKTKKWTKIDQNNDDQTKDFKEKFDYSLPVEVTYFGVGANAAWSAVHGGDEKNGKVGGYKWDVDVAKAEAHANAGVGYGNISASAGASFTALSASGKAYLGNENFNGYVEGEVVAGKVGAEGEISLGWRDSKGHFNPNAHAGVKAEAIAGEISGKAGVTVAGVDVGVKGSLNYGVGAHLDVGVKDGKVSLDIGATLGVGGSVKVEVDVSKPIKAVGKWVKSLKWW